MSVSVSSIGLKGLEGYVIQVEVHLLPGMESMHIVGLPDASVKESRERVMAALHSLGISLPEKKIIVNLSPSEQKKNGPFFDLAMAVGILKSIGKIEASIPRHAAFLGALSLDGSVRSVTGILPAVLAAKKENIQTVYLAYDPTLPLSLIDGIELRFVEHLSEVLDSLAGHGTLMAPTRVAEKATEMVYEQDFSYITGHKGAKRALEIAAAGGHNVLMSGPPGCGKSLLADTFPTIFPPLSKEAQLEVISLYQLAGSSYVSSSIPPYRHPHHSSSAVAIIGGGTNPKPGEISLAHRGILFLDELAEFSRKTLDMLRQPLETGKVTISRVHSTVTYPADFLFIGAMNPCPCGYLGSKTHYCTCTPKQVKAYQTRVSGPIKDRMDILLALQPVDLHRREEEETSAVIRDRVIMARQSQYERYDKEMTNANVTMELLNKVSPLTTRQQLLLQEGISTHHWSNRVQIKIIRLARTIADLEGEMSITDEALVEAMTYRR
ncbi:YifB family Mg chelatase-like AAA ATPase [Alkalihalobacterium alkalinitrilicum]|uniref:YifB family Mg chelatase-like AAA ATPase n=1 Tax=Alkalihalobacterium alkalinitrilicum TaxID=427920 RepID=UPI0009954E48|nr:YifB family Mg chelatase-like AAA ATPase [Alkalihalobacterium alkalinitrilicum]